MMAEKIDYSKYIAASYVPALFGVSPYVTEWMLYRRLHDNIKLYTGDMNDRQLWGLRLEPVIIQAVAEQYALEVTPHDQKDYVTHPEHPLGAKKDAEIICPSRGRGVVDAKNVDGFIFRQFWPEDHAPAHIELQVQTQMLVEQASWGIIAVLVGGNELVCYEREPIPDVQQQIIERAHAMFDRVARSDPPDPFGVPAEAPIIRQLWPVATPDAVADFAEAECCGDLDELIMLYQHAQHEKNRYDNTAQECKTLLFHKAQDADVLLTDLYRVKLSRKNGLRITSIKDR